MDIDAEKEINRKPRCGAVASGSRKIALIAVCAALLTGGKLALSALPNIEVVTSFLLVYSLLFGFWISVPAALVFCGVECAIYGVGTWVVSYFLYFPGFAALTCLLRLLPPGKKQYFASLVSVFVCTAFFGVLTTAVDALFWSQGDGALFLTLFSAFYVRGIVFYALHIVGNLAISSALLPVLSRLRPRVCALGVSACASKTREKVARG